MENDLNSSSSALFAMEISSDHISNGYFHSTNTFDDPFESALSSMVSSPTAHPSAGVVSGDAMMIRELIGRLGSICENTGDISPQSCIATANNTPLNSPPKFNLSSLSLVNQISPNFPTHPPTLAYFNGDPGFAERAAKFSSFGRGETGIGNRSGTNLQSGKLSRVSSCLSNREGSSGVMSEKISTEMGDSREGSSVSEPNTAGEIGRKAQNDANSRKRKSISEPKIKEDKSDKEEAEKEREESNSKRSKTEEEEAKRKNAGGESHNNSKDKQSSSKNNSNNNNINNIDSKNNDNGNNNNKEAAAKPEPPKDYIHVRARRGQATDSHSLAERARREKISERMKFLQDLVPGCNKVTGKATVLDEIINYVQSLQSQVEFLSMKLATVNPRMEFNMDALLSNDMFQCRGSSMPQTMYPIDQNSATQAFPFGYRSSQQLPPTLLNGIPNGTENPFSLNPLNPPKINGNPTIQLPSIAGSNDPMTQMPTFWQDDL